MWDQLSIQTKILALAGESTVMEELLVDDTCLMNLIRSGCSFDECLAHINQNF